MKKQLSLSEIKTEIFARPTYSELNIIQKINTKGNAESYAKYWTNRKPGGLHLIIMDTVASRYDGLIEWNKNLHSGYRY